MDGSCGRMGKWLELGRRRYTPGAYPYTVVANKAGTKAWVSLSNSAAVAELNLETGNVARWIDITKPTDAIDPSSHATAMLLSPSEETLYVALANADMIAAVDLKAGFAFIRYRTGSRTPGSVLQAIALSPDGKHLYAASASLDAIAGIEVRELPKGTTYAVINVGVKPNDDPVGVIPTEWYPSALAIAGNDLLIATAKGESSGPNTMQGQLKAKRKRKEHPAIATLT